ncbi:MAG TPA: hypothetical protein VNE39_17330 [Planctomycetota bacterium]|nr:hypothetical protein [Planctomycetota bacterium]
MTRSLCTLLILLGAGAAARGDVVTESWGGEGKLTHPGTLKVVSVPGQAPRLLFDLSAIPRDATVLHASLSCAGGQPREPIRVLVADAPGVGPLKLEEPWCRSLDATEAVRTRVAEPARNLGLVAEALSGPPAACRLEVRYEGKAGRVPPQVEGLRAIHHDGQTFLRWRELPVYRPPAEATLWITRMAGLKTETAREPGKGVRDFPRAAAITLKTLRDLQGLAVRDKPAGRMRRDMAPFVRLREVPEVRYRVYRHSERITPATLKNAQLVGEADALCAYQDGFIHIHSHGEYYDPYEEGQSVIPTWSVGAGEPVLPGEAYYVHAPSAAGNVHYAVTSVQDGTENASAITDANSLAQPIEERAEPRQPVPQFVTVNRTRYGQADAAEHWFAYWLAPPFANVADNRPRRVVMAMSDAWKTPGPLSVSTRPGVGPGWKVDKLDTAYFYVEQDVAYGGDLCYSQGRDTLRSVRESKVDYFSDRYVTAMVQWALSKWDVDRSRLTSSVGTHYGVRHPELFPILWIGPYEVDYDQKWNPACGSLAGRLGPRELAETVDGAPAWDAFNIAWYLASNQDKDIPFWVHDVGGKEGGHAVEFGWQDDGKGLAALRDARQPHIAHWGGGSWSREVTAGLASMRWGGSVPAFSRCSLDGNPGNGDPADGDPWGQINGFLFWDPADTVDEATKWAMTVFLTQDCGDDVCTVDVTPRRCRVFKPRPGERFRWTNTSSADGKVVQSGETTADKWGLVTVPAARVGKGRSRITLTRD